MTDHGPAAPDALREGFARLAEIDEEVTKLRAAALACGETAEIYRSRLEAARALLGEHRRLLGQLEDGLVPDAGVVACLRASIKFEELLESTLRRQVEEESARVDAFVGQVNTTIERRCNERGALRRELPAALVTSYDRLTGAGECAFTLVCQGACSSCGAAVPNGAAVKDDLSLCPRCGRIVCGDAAWIDGASVG